MKHCVSTVRFAISFSLSCNRLFVKEKTAQEKEEETSLDPAFNSFYLTEDPLEVGDDFFSFLWSQLLDLL